ncbi:MAG TPA: hypothetical protein VLE25_01550 [Nitrospira sp.]|nr:hypothetical protein [Nitrospira sp.]
MTRGMYTAATGLYLTITVWAPASAQTLPGTPQNQQAAPLISPIQPASAPTSGIPANVITPATTNQLEAGTTAPGRVPVFSGAGRGLPGMPGGPPLHSPLGANDPSAQYMRPPTVGPLFCDPAVDIQC